MALRKLNIVSHGYVSSRRTAKDEGLVCVTGSWSILGSWIVKLLLEQGYAVKSAVPHKPEELSALLFSNVAEERLQLSEADLLDYGSLSELFEGCTSVFHVPAPNFDINGSRDYPVELIDLEVRSVLNIVEACSNASSVKKLVLTSCLSSVLWDCQYYSSGIVLDERNWSDVDFCRKEKMWYALCKTMAEKAAWALARDKGFDLVVLNPANVVGPKEVHLGASCVFSSLVLDQTGIFAYVHVDDLAMAHILALQADHASGRYICFEHLLSKLDIIEAARELYPNQNISKRLESFNPCMLSNAKLKGLGMLFSSDAEIMA